MPWTESDIADALRLSQPLDVSMPSGTTVAGGYHNLNRLNAGSWGQMAIPGLASAGGTIHTKGTLGFPSFTNAGAGKSLRALLSSIGSNTSGTLYLYDRLWSCSGMVGNVATAQTVTAPPALTRPDALGAEAEIFVEDYTAIGATAANVTANYTNAANTAGRVTVSEAIIASMPASRMQRLRLQSPAEGCRSTQSLTLSVSTGTAGNIGVTLAKRLATIRLVANVAEIMDYLMLAASKVPNDAALMLVLLASATVSGTIMGDIKLGELSD